jgi:AbrB family looped-hinge helix DNA binding protein
MKSAITMNSKAIVSSKGQVVIPRKLREKVGIYTGNELLFKARPDGVIEIRRLTRSIDMFFGRCKRKNESSLSIKDIDAAIMQAIIENDTETS